MPLLSHRLECETGSMPHFTFPDVDVADSCSSTYASPRAVASWSSSRSARDIARPRRMRLMKPQSDATSCPLSRGWLPSIRRRRVSQGDFFVVVFVVDDKRMGAKTGHDRVEMCVRHSSITAAPPKVFSSCWHHPFGYESGVASCLCAHCSVTPK